jgi:mevalonate kinase
MHQLNHHPQTINTSQDPAFFADARYYARLPQVAASACGKAILFGEHGVVYGAKAVAMPISEMRLTVNIKASRKPAMFLAQREVTDHLYQVVRQGFEVLNQDYVPVTVQCDSNFLIGAGLGSSAALCVAILRGLDQMFDLKQSPLTLARLANTLEERFHGTPSGLDATVVALEQTILFQKGEPPELLPINGPKNSDGTTKSSGWPFLLIDTGLRSQTITMVERAKPFFKQNKGAVKDFDDISKEGSEGLVHGQSGKVNDCMKRSTALLRSAGVVNDEMDRLIKLCENLGALAAKPTGAGGGGCILTLAGKDRHKPLAKELTTKLKRKCVLAWELL